MKKNISPFVALIFFLTQLGILHAADTCLRGFNVNNWHLSPDHSGVFSVYGSQTLGHLKPSFRLSTQIAGSLIQAGNPVNNQTTDLMKTLLTSDMAVAIGLTDYMDMGVIVPVIAYDRSMNVDIQQRFTYQGVGDLLFDLKVRILKDRAKQVGLGAISRLSVPTGNDKNFLGSSKPTGELGLVLDKTLGSFYLASNVGYRFADKVTVRNVISGRNWNIHDDDRFIFGLGAKYSLPFQNRSWALSASLVGSVIANDIKKISTPVLVNAGLQKRWNNGGFVEMGGGRGLTNAVGSPSYHAFLSIGYGGGFAYRKKKEKYPETAEGEKIKRTLYFAFNSDQIDPKENDQLREIAENLAQNENYNVIVEGHSDSMGSKRYNMRLSQKRAEKVKQYLIWFGADRNQIDIKCFGESMPVATNITFEERAKNRRVEIQQIK